MIIGSMLAGLALLVVVVMYLAKPFFVARRRPAADQSRRQQLETEKEALLIQINALDFDYETRKIPTEVYEIQRAELMEQAAVTLKEIDALPAGGGQDISFQIEAAIAEIRQQHTFAGNGQVSFCPNCGRALEADDNFCAGCGQPVGKVELTH